MLELASRHIENNDSVTTLSKQFALRLLLLLCRFASLCHQCPRRSGTLHLFNKRIDFFNLSHNVSHMLNKFILIFLVSLLFFGCFPNGQSRRSQCKRGYGYGYIDNALRERNSWCSIFLLQISEPPGPRNLGLQNPSLALCITSQNYLNECERETTLPLGYDDIK